MRINDSGPEYNALGHCRIQEWSAAYYAQAESGKALSITTAGAPFHHLCGGVGGSGAQKGLGHRKVYNLNRLSDFSGTYHGISRGLTLIEEDACEADEPEWRDHVSRPDRRLASSWSASIEVNLTD